AGIWFLRLIALRTIQGIPNRIGPAAKEARMTVRGLLCLAGWLLAVPWLRAQSPYDGIQAGLDAYNMAEGRRRAEVDAQLFANDQARAWAGLPTTRGETIYYGNAYPGNAYYGHALPPANWEAAYAYGNRRGWSSVRERVWFSSPTVFEPWPVVPGDIYGYRYVAPVRQPIGQRQVQTGPNRWESHPVYDPPVTHYRPLPPVETPADPTPATEEPNFKEPSRVPVDDPFVPPPPPLPPRSSLRDL
ncbi:MAG: hypothetical protein WEB67_06890, partial [Acidimicrobiia bacterium]